MSRSYNWLAWKEVLRYATGIGLQLMPPPHHNSKGKVQEKLFDTQNQKYGCLYHAYHCLEKYNYLGRLLNDQYLKDVFHEMDSTTRAHSLTRFKRYLSTRLDCAVLEVKHDQESRDSRSQTLLRQWKHSCPLATSDDQSSLPSSPVHKVRAFYLNSESHGMLFKQKSGALSQSFFIGFSQKNRGNIL